MGKMYTRFQNKTAQKNHPDGAAHTYVAYIREYLPPPGGGGVNTFLIPEIFMFLATWYCIHGQHTRYCNNTAFQQG